MLAGLFRERRRLDDKEDDGLGSLKRRRSCQSETE